MKILITGGKSATALKLIKAFPKHKVLLADYGEMPTIPSKLYRFTALGTWNEAVLAHHLLTKCLDEKVDALLPLYAAEISAVARSLILFEEFGIKVFVPEMAELQGAFNDSANKHWCIFDVGELLYSSTEHDHTGNSEATMNGVYYFDCVSSKYELVFLANPV